jgi:metal-responsive CopG/Arc/MetJ family transcriptional regulator
MKTAISIDGALLQQADEAAESLGISRSRLFAAAVADFLKKRRHDEILTRLNAAYAGQSDSGDAKLLKSMKTATRRTLRDRW